MYFVTEARLCSIKTTPETIYKILKSLNVNKAVGPDGISNKILKECALSLSEPLSFLYNQSLSSGVYPTCWKDADLFPLFKSNEKHLRNNYRPISLLTCMSKCFEMCVFKDLYRYCVVNNLLTWRNSGFKHGDSTICQLTALVHMLYDNMDKGRDITMIFLDVSKAFDKVWHDGILFKLQTFGIHGPLLCWFRSYLTNRRQRVVIKGANSPWFPTNAGVPQGSVLGPLLFLIFINDMECATQCQMRMFADDTHVYDISNDYQNSVQNINNDLLSLQHWATQWRVTFNPQKTVYMVFSRKTINNVFPSDIYFNGIPLARVSEHKHLGIILNEKLLWDSHIDYINEKVSSRLSAMRRLIFIVPRRCLENIYKTMVRPIIDYGDILFPHLPVNLSKRLENLQRQAALICTRAYVRTPHVLLLSELGWEDLYIRRQFHSLCMMYKIQNGFAPQYLCNICPPNTGQTTGYNLRNSDNIISVYCKYKPFSRSFFPYTIKQWNGLLESVRLVTTINIFKKKLTEHMLSKQNKLFSHFHSHASVNHTRLRLGLSGLNSHRAHFNFIENGTCPKCGHETEDVHHFFFVCNRYAALREELLESVLHIVGPEHYVFNFHGRNNIVRSSKFMLNGDLSSSFENNVAIFKAIHKFILSTKRFI